VWYLRGHLGQRFASTATVAPKTDAFVRSVQRFVADAEVDLVSFAKHERKDDMTREYLQRFDADEGAVRRAGAGEGAGRAHRATPLRTHHRRAATCAPMARTSRRRRCGARGGARIRATSCGRIDESVRADGGCL